ncbi:hypothetical protein P0E69_21900 (plasmid) [Chimaeribacter arupi]|uniref:hypothetical protein n=1 Tax=Chimaeribacter arupi TaxID=2060066 RepID=UPI00271208E8|nr:hypothetical protein [Chimaeribacter arupi]WKZ94863.1 hypothetical protein P0E69_21900 [Chimaeribacter arupi]
MMNGYELSTSFRLVKLTVLAAEDDANLLETAFSLKLLSDYRDDLMDEYPEEYI